MKSYERALQLKPDYAEAHMNLGNALQALNRASESVERYEHALRLKPDFADAHMNLGAALQMLGRSEDAVRHYERALELKEGFTEAHRNLGVALHALGRIDEAMVHYKRALVLNPNFAEAHMNLGAALHDLGYVSESIERYESALALNPALADVYINFGNSLQKLGQTDEAMRRYEQALGLKPDSAEAHRNIGVMLQELGRPEESANHYKLALALKPDFAEAENGLMHQLQHLCDWPKLPKIIEHQRQLLHSASPPLVSPFTILCIPSSPLEQLICARNWAARRLGSATGHRKSMGFQFGRMPKSKLRIGYLSADFHQHATAHLMVEMLELHDRDGFEVVGYSYGPDDGSEMRKRLVRACDRFVDIRTEPFDVAARRIHADGIDILVDLKGYTTGARTEIVALKPAPVQVSFLGYPGTMGVDFIDYIIADRFVCPPDQEKFFSEKIAYLGDCYQINDRKRKVARRTPTRRECGLPEKGMILCCLNNTYKITAEIFDVWMRLLQAKPDSVLWLLEANHAVTINLRREATVRGVNPDRLVFASRVSPDKHLARLRIADLFLDTTPVNAHTTASDALWVGLPVLTCAGATFVSRVAGSLLTSIGAPELITSTLSEYESTALNLIHNPEELLKVRKRIAKNRLTSPLFDSARYTQQLETIFRKMWEIYAKGELPRCIK